MAINMSQTKRAPDAQISPLEAVVTLLEKAVMASIEEAIGAIEANDIETRCNQINLASEIVSMLHLGLDLEQGGETAERLAAIYRFVLAKLILINIQNDAKLAQEIIAVLTPVRDAWSEVLDQTVSGNGNLDLDSVIASSVDTSDRKIRRATAA